MSGGAGARDPPPVRPAPRLWASPATAETAAPGGRLPRRPCFSPPQTVRGPAPGASERAEGTSSDAADRVRPPVGAGDPVGASVPPPLPYRAPAWQDPPCIPSAVPPAGSAPGNEEDACGSPAEVLSAHGGGAVPGRELASPSFFWGGGPRVSLDVTGPAGRGAPVKKKSTAILDEEEIGTLPAPPPVFAKISKVVLCVGRSADKMRT